MTSIVFPSEAFPAVPTLQLELPPDWVPRVIPGTILGAMLERGADRFSPNVVATHDRATATGLDQAEGAVDAYLETLVDLQVIDRQRVSLNDRQWAVAEFAHVVESVGTTVQVVLVTVVENGPVTDTLRLTGTTDTDDLENALSQLRQILASAVVTIAP